MCLVTRTSIVRCGICLSRSTPGGGPWLLPTGNWFPTLPSTTQQLDTPPLAHMETAGGPSITPTPSDSVQLVTHSSGREDWTTSTDTTQPIGRKYSKTFLNFGTLFLKAIKFRKFRKAHCSPPLVGWNNSVAFSLLIWCHRQSLFFQHQWRWTNTPLLQETQFNAKVYKPCQDVLKKIPSVHSRVAQNLSFMLGYTLKQG